MQKLFFLLLVPVFFLTSCGTTLTNTPSSASTQTTEKVTYVDVRESSEWAAGHIEWAILVPLGQIESGDFSQIPRDTPVSLYCRSGRRSGIAYDILKKAGYTNITDRWGMDQIPWVKIVR